MSSCPKKFLSELRHYLVSLLFTLLTSSSEASEACFFEDLVSFYLKFKLVPFQCYLFEPVIEEIVPGEPPNSSIEGCLLITTLENQPDVKYCRFTIFVSYRLCKKNPYNGIFISKKEMKYNPRSSL